MEIGNNVTLQVGMENLIYVYNNTGSILPNGAPVYVTGTYGGHRTVALAKADVWATSQVIGITTQAIGISAFGYINQFGYVNGLNTNSYTLGDTLWLSPINAGEFVTTEPADPYFAVQCARVLLKDASNGRIGFVGRIPMRINDLSDANIVTPVTDQVLRWNGTYWTNGSISGAAGKRWFIPIPTKVDTSVAVSGKDSLIVIEYGNATAGIDSSIFARAQGNGTAPADTLGAIQVNRGRMSLVCFRWSRARYTPPIAEIMPTGAMIPRLLSVPSLWRIR